MGCSMRQGDQVVTVSIMADSQRHLPASCQSALVFGWLMLVLLLQVCCISCITGTDLHTIDCKSA